MKVVWKCFLVAMKSWVSYAGILPFLFLQVEVHSFSSIFGITNCTFHFCCYIMQCVFTYIFFCKVNELYQKMKLVTRWSQKWKTQQKFLKFCFALQMFLLVWWHFGPWVDCFQHQRFSQEFSVGVVTLTFFFLLIQWLLFRG